MARLPSFRRLNIGDYEPNEQGIVNKLALSINPGFESLYDVLNRKVTLTDNIRCTLRTVDVEVDSAGRPKIQTSISTEFNAPVMMCIVGSATNLTNSGTYPTSAPFISFTQNNNSILINNIAGLPQDTSFRLSVVLFYS